jgi:serine/threonine protein kinase
MVSLSDFEILDQISDGSSCKVYKVKYKLDEKIYVLKKVNRVGNEGISDFVVSRIVHNERIILPKLDHPNIVKLRHFIEDTTSYYFIMDDCGKDLISLEKRTTESEAIKYLRQIIDALVYGPK